MISIKRLKGEKVYGTGRKMSKIKRFNVGAHMLLFLLFNIGKNTHFVVQYSGIPFI